MLLFLVYRLTKKILTELGNIPNLYWYKFPIMGSLSGPGISLKGFVLLDPTILTPLEKDDKDLAALNMMQLLKYLQYVTAILIAM
jgi:hypothetical protein